MQVARVDKSIQTPERRMRATRRDATVSSVSVVRGRRGKAFRLKVLKREIRVLQRIGYAAIPRIDRRQWGSRREVGGVSRAFVERRGGEIER